MLANDRISYVRAVVIAGLVFAAVYVILPSLWYLAPFSSFAAGYLSLRFRDVLSKIPIALEQTSAGLSRALHASAYERGLVFAALIGCTVYSIIEYTHPEIYNHSLLPLWVVRLLIYALALMMSVLITQLLMHLGAQQRDHCYWAANPLTPSETEIKKKKLIEKPCTYRNMLRWFGQGLLVVGIFLLLTWWTKTLWLITVFVWKFILLIHSEERVLAGIDGTATGALGCWALYSTGMGFVETATLFIGTALIGVLIAGPHYSVAQFLKTHFATPQVA